MSVFPRHLVALFIFAINYTFYVAIK